MTKKSSWLIVGLFVISIGILCSMPQAMAETLSYKFLIPVTLRQVVQVGDVPSHWVGIMVREGSAALETGEMAWVKGVMTFDVSRAKLLPWKHSEDSCDRSRGLGKTAEVRAG